MTRPIYLKLTFANTFFRRLKGLLGTDMLPMDQGLLLEPCNSIHTWGMRYPIDALYLNGYNKVLYIEKELAPNQWGKHIKEAEKVLELKAGMAESLEIKIGERIEFLKERRDPVEIQYEA